MPLPGISAIIPVSANTGAQRGQYRMRKTRQNVSHHRYRILILAGLFDRKVIGIRASPRSAWNSRNPDPATAPHQGREGLHHPSFRHPDRRQCVRDTKALDMMDVLVHKTNRTCIDTGTIPISALPGLMTILSSKNESYGILGVTLGNHDSGIADRN